MNVLRIAEEIISTFKSAIRAELEQFKQWYPSSPLTINDAKEIYLRSVYKALQRYGLNGKEIIRIFSWAIYLEAVKRSNIPHAQDVGKRKTWEWNRIYEWKDDLIASYTTSLHSVLNKYNKRRWIRWKK